MNLLFTISAGVFFTIFLFNWFLPYVTPKNVQFGIRVPRENESNPIFNKMRTRYHVRLAIGSLMIGGSLLILPLFIGEISLTLFSIIAEVPFVYLNYYVIFRELGSIKEKEKWYEGPTEKDSVFYSQDSITVNSVLSIFFLIPAISMIAVSSLVGVYIYASLPAMIPKLLSKESLIPKTFLSVFYLVAIATVLTVGIFVYGYAVSHTRQEIDSSRPAVTFLQQERFKTYYQDILYLHASLIGVMLFTASLIRWGIIKDTFGLAPLYAPILLGAGITIAGPMMMGQMGSRLFRNLPQIENSGASNLNDDRQWKGGILYYNKQDPSVLVGNRFGIGWTFNLANPKSWIILTAILIMVTVDLVLILKSLV